jgi:uncharacterized membrane protein YidH (DUF202 family)
MEAISVILINVFVLAAGVFLYLKIRRDMRKKQVPNAPNIPIMLLFLGFCGWLALLLTFLLRPLSGVFSIEYFILLLPMPILVLGSIGWLIPLRKISRYHRYALAASVFYLVIPACIWVFLLPTIIRTKY